MAAYMIYNLIEVTDPELMAQYRSKVSATTEKYGGRTLANGDYEVMEGEWSGARTVISEFPDMETLKAWYHSDDYKPLLGMRLRAARGNFVVVNGV